MSYKIIQRVSVLNLKLFGSVKTELWAIEVEEIFIMLYGKMGGLALFAHQYGSHNIIV